MTFLTTETIDKTSIHQFQIRALNSDEMIDFKDFEGKVAQVDEARGKVKVLVNMFGRETPVELDFLQIKKI